MLVLLACEWMVWFVIGRASTPPSCGFEPRLVPRAARGANPRPRGAGSGRRPRGVLPAEDERRPSDARRDGCSREPVEPVRGKHGTGDHEEESRGGEPLGDFLLLGRVADPRPQVLVDLG